MKRVWSYSSTPKANEISYNIISSTDPVTREVIRVRMLVNIGEVHYHKENKTNGGKQIEFSEESNQFEKKNIKSGNK